MVDKNQDILYGGQAVIEGVMMRSPRYFAVACRHPKGEVIVQKEEVKAFWGRFRALRIPFVRGVFVLLDALALGMKSLMFAANIASDTEENEKKAKKEQSQGQDAAGAPSESTQPKAQKHPQKISDLAIGLTMALGLGIGIVLFVVFPNVVAGWLRAPLNDNSFYLNLVDGLLRILIFIGYVALISLMKDIRRVFQYHGAEHKSINAFEEGRELTMEMVKDYSTRHVRCGTSFIALVLILSIFVFSFFSWDNILERVGSRVIGLPIVAGVSYEIIRFVGRRKDSRLTRVLVAPGMLFQRLTTREPDERQVEVALTALKAVVEAEESAPAEAKTA